MAKPQEFERMVKDSIDYILEINDVIGLATRIPQVKFISQNIDVIVDFNNQKLYNLGIECKTINLHDRKTKNVKLNTIYTPKQQKNEREFIKKTGRKGYVIFAIKESDKLTRYFITNIYTCHRELRKININSENLKQTSKVMELYLTEYEMLDIPIKTLVIKIQE